MTARVFKIALVFLLGVGVGFVLSEFARSGIDDERPGEIADDPGVATPPHRTASDNSLEDPTPLRRLVDAIPGPTFGRGNGTLQGTVQTADGTPVEEVLIEAYLEQSPTDEVATSRPAAALEDAVRQTILAGRRRRETRRQTRTKANGAFVLEGLVDGAHTITGSLPGYEIALRRGSPRSLQTSALVHPGATVDFLARPVGSLRVDIVLEDGTTPRDATVKYSRTQSHTQRTMNWSPLGRTLTLPTGTYRLDATHGIDDEYRAKATVVVDRSDSKATAKLVLAARSGIRGTVRFPDGDAYDTAVYVLPWAGEEQPPEKQIVAGGKVTSARRDTGFSYRMLDLPPGRYAIAAGRRPNQIETIDFVQIPGEVVEHDLTLPLLDSAEYLILRAFSPDGALLRDLSIRAKFQADGNGYSRGGGQARSDGSYLVFHATRGDVKPAEERPLLRRGAVDALRQQRSGVRVAGNHGTRRALRSSIVLGRRTGGLL